MTRSLRRHATKLCLAGFPVAGSLLSQEAMTGFLRLATKMAMNRAARTAERRPRRVPLSRLTGARPTGAAILRRVGPHAAATQRYKERPQGASGRAHGADPGKSGPCLAAGTASRHGCFYLNPTFLRRRA